jgi:hypothetical protein
MRTCILHYHLFKNAGSSVDKILEENFGSAWTTRELFGSESTIPQQVTDWIQSEPDKIAFSSHTAVGPLPQIADTQIIPIIFLRHPFDRLRSAYEFERAQGAQTFGSVLARETSLTGYLRVMMAARGDRSAKNFHVQRLASFATSPATTELEKAVAAAQSLAFVGVVDEFERSMQIFANLVRPYLGDLATPHVRENATTGSDSSLSERLAQMRDDIGDETWEKLLQCNSEDLELYRMASTSSTALDL